MRHISIQSFKEVVKAEQGNSSIDFINVCTPTEYKEKHIEGVRNVPLDELGGHTADFKDKQTVYVHCRSGKRAGKAIEKLQAMGVTAELVNVEGGLIAWEEAGLPTNSLSNRIPIMRQVLLIAGLLVLTATGLGWLVDQWFMLLAGIVGIGLTVAGATGWCGMSYVLDKMPWNK